jgi:short subunit dehydrogenase-like uncharacterized protein
VEVSSSTTTTKKEEESMPTMTKEEFRTRLLKDQAMREKRKMDEVIGYLREKGSRSGVERAKWSKVKATTVLRGVLR